MKILKRILITLVIFIIVIFVAGSVYVKLYGKGLLENALHRSLKRNVVLGEASYAFPLGLKAHNIQIAQPEGGGKFFEAQDIFAQLSLEAVFQRKIIFDSVILVKPSVFIEIKEESDDGQQERRHGLNLPPLDPGTPVDKKISKEKRARTQLEKTEIVIKQAVLRQGQIQYVNSFGDKDFSFGLEDVYLKARNLIFPAKAQRTDFNLSGRLVKEGNPLSGSTAEGHGWFDPVSLDMDAQIEIVEEDGTVGLTAKAVAKNNDMDVSGEVKFLNLLSGMKSKGESDSATLDTLIFDALSTAGVEIGAKYSFKTKMDDFRPAQVSFSGNVLTK